MFYTRRSSGIGSCWLSGGYQLRAPHFCTSESVIFWLFICPFGLVFQGRQCRYVRPYGTARYWRYWTRPRQERLLPPLVENWAWAELRFLSAGSKTVAWKRHWWHGSRSLRLKTGVWRRQMPMRDSRPEIIQEAMIKKCESNLSDVKWSKRRLLSV